MKAATRLDEIQQEADNTKRSYIHIQLTLTDSQRNIHDVRIIPALVVRFFQLSRRQSQTIELVSFASLLAISGTFNSLSKVLFTFPSRYLFSIGLRSVFSFRGKLPPI